MLGETHNQFSLTRAALSTCRAEKHILININSYQLTLDAIDDREIVAPWVGSEDAVQIVETNKDFRAHTRANRIRKDRKQD